VKLTDSKIRSNPARLNLVQEELSCRIDPRHRRSAIETQYNGQRSRFKLLEDERFIDGLRKAR
jgi:hypothetical protein